jgi:uncharacterized protein (TIGR03083 family)
MSQLAVEGLRAERDAILTVAKSLTDEEWNLPSDCDGWAVRDVLAHMAAVLHGVHDPAYMVDMSGGTEAAMEAPVAERRTWKIEEVIAEYESSSEQVANVVAMFQDPSMGENLLPMGDLGTHPMSLLASTMVFDAYCHLRNDILKPNGPIDRPQPPRDEQRLQPTVEWMLAGLPWMSEKELAFMDRPIALTLDGPGGGTWTIGPVGDEGRVQVREGTLDAVATATSSSHDFVVWGTGRRPWRDLVKIEGDEAYAARVLDAMKIF